MADSSKSSAPGPRDDASRLRLERKERFQRRLTAAKFERTAFLRDIIATGELLLAARTFDGVPALRSNARSRLLRAIEQIGGAPTISDIARRLRVTRAAARRVALSAELVGLVEIFPDPDDRRALQIMLTQRGSKSVAASRTPETTWLFTLLNGLEQPAMRTTSHVLDVLRQRLQRMEADRKAAMRHR